MKKTPKKLFDCVPPTLKSATGRAACCGAVAIAAMGGAAASLVNATPPAIEASTEAVVASQEAYYNARTSLSKAEEALAASIKGKGTTDVACADILTLAKSQDAEARGHLASAPLSAVATDGKEAQEVAARVNQEDAVKMERLAASIKATAGALDDSAALKDARDDAEAALTEVAQVRDADAGKASGDVLSDFDAKVQSVKDAGSKSDTAAIASAVAEVKTASDALHESAEATRAEEARKAAEDVWHVSYTWCSSNEQAVLDAGYTIRFTGFNLIAAHSHLSAGQNIKARHTYVVVDGVKYRYAGERYVYRRGRATVNDQDAWIGSGNIGFQTCNDSDYFLITKYVPC